MVQQEIKTMVDLLLLLLTTGAFVDSNSVNSVNLCYNSEVDYENYTDSRTEICGCEQRHSCVRKCCQSGFQHFHNEHLYQGLYISVCTKKKSNYSNFTVPIYNVTKQVDIEETFMVGMLDCRNENWWQYFKLNNDDPRQKFYIQKNGSLYYAFHNKIYGNDRYCVDEENGLTAYVCFTPPHNTVEGAEKKIHVSAKLATLPFLLTTFIVYAILPQSGLHGRALMCHVLCLIFGNSWLAIAQYNSIQEDTFCQILGFSIIFFMLASFFWMNVMCIDIWLAFSGFRDQINLEKKISLLCNTYAWGMPAILVLVIFLMNTYGDNKSPLYPGVGTNSCFINGELQIFVYYFGPILIIVLINAVLFILTSINIRKVQRETSMLEHYDSRRHTSSEDDQKKFNLYWKLLFAMGINPVINYHLIQAVSWSIGWKYSNDNARYIYYLKDVAHIMYAIFIFITYVCKKKIWEDLKKRYFVFIGRPIQVNCMPQTALSNISISEGAGVQFSNNAKDRKEEAV